MKVFGQVIKNIIMVASLCLLLAACNKVSRESFDKVNTKMTMNEVVTILGEPTSADSVDIAGVKGTSAVWKNGDNVVTIQFLNGGVFLKTFSRTPEQNNKD